MKSPVRFLKAKLRDWLFSDFKWITRAQVQREVSALKWQHRHSPLVMRALDDLKARLK